MIEILFVLTSFNHNSFNNSIYFEICDSKYNASYIYFDSSDIIFGVVENSEMLHYNYSLIEICNQTAAHNFESKSTTENHETVPTREPFYTVTALQSNDIILQNLTSDIVEGREKCNMFDYSFIIVSVFTFLIGLALKPEAVYELLRRFLNNPIYAGNNISSIRIKLLELLFRHSSDSIVKRKTVVVRFIIIQLALTSFSSI